MEAEITKEEQLLCARAAEMAASAEYATAAMPFLTPRERLLVHDALLRCHQADRAFSGADVWAVNGPWPFFCRTGG